jgi:hypothetical protein
VPLSAVPPLKVEVNIKVIYEGATLRPSAFEVKYKIDGKAIEPIRISDRK